MAIALKKEAWGVLKCNHYNGMLIQLFDSLDLCMHITIKGEKSVNHILKLAVK